MKFKGVNNRTIVHVPQRINDKVTVAGKEFILDHVFRQYWNTVQMTEVVATGNSELDEGDRVYVHHFVSAKEHRIPVEGNYSWIEDFQIYCKVNDGIVKAIGDYLLVEPVTWGELGKSERPSGLITSTKSASENMERIGRAKHLSDTAIKYGLEENDMILFGKNCEYEILIEGQVYYAMEMRDVITVIGDEVKVKV